MTNKQKKAIDNFAKRIVKTSIFIDAKTVNEKSSGIVKILTLKKFIINFNRLVKELKDERSTKSKKSSN